MAQPWVRRLSREAALHWLALALIVGVAAALRFSNLDALGYSNHYYTAGVESMLQSWRNRPPLIALLTSSSVVTFVT